MPFCAARCDYCAFATWTDRHHLQRTYLEACRRDVERAVAAAMPPATSIFVGGGTPSMVPPSDLVAVLDAVPRAPGCEVTIECNPDTVTPELAEAYAQGGVNRISLGVQSMVDHVLHGLGRTHDPDNVRRAVTLVRDVGIPAINLDLIYGGAGESVDDWRRTVESALELDPPHVSAYALTVEPGTALAEAYAAGGVNRVSLGVQSMVDHVLVALGRTHDPANVRRAVAWFRQAGIPTLNLDLIYGSRVESRDD